SRSISRSRTSSAAAMAPRTARPPPRTRISLKPDRKPRSEEHTSELQSPCNLVCRLLLEKKKKRNQAVAFSTGKFRPQHETNIGISARRPGNYENSHTVLDGLLTTMMATVPSLHNIGSRE